MQKEYVAKRNAAALHDDGYLGNGIGNRDRVGRDVVQRESGESASRAKDFKDRDLRRIWQHGEMLGSVSSKGGFELMVIAGDLRRSER